MLSPLIRISPRDAPALLHGVIEVNRRQMRRAGRSRLLVADAIARGIFRYDPADPDEHWITYDEAMQQVAAQGFALLDCEDLAALVAAELRETGEDPKAFPYIYRIPGTRKWHVITGSPRYDRWLDPSVAAGMGRE